MTNFANCTAALIYPFLPGPKPEDFGDVLGLETEGAKEGVDYAEDGTGAAANQIKNASRIGPSRAARIARLENRAAKLEKFWKGLKALGYLQAANQARENMKHCTK